MQLFGIIACKKHQALAVVGFVREKLTTEGFFAVEGGPGELTAVVIQEARSKAETASGG